MTDDCRNESPVLIPITGTLDLHTFRPSEVHELVPDYIYECIARGIFEIRIIHGKGTGALRETVHSILKKMPEVDSFMLADETSGSWGATLAKIKRNT